MRICNDISYVKKPIYIYIYIKCMYEIVCFIHYTLAV